MSTPWSPAQVTIHPLGPWSLPQATAWRQAAEDELAPPSRGEVPPGAMAAAIPLAIPLATATLAAWLRDAGRSTSLHLAVALGGGQPAVAWLGLSQRAETAPAAQKALREATEDLGSLLDAWSWFQHRSPTAPAHLDLPALHLVDTRGDPHSMLETAGPWSAPQSPAVLQLLAGRPERVGLHLSITPAVADIALVQAAEQAARQAVATEERSFPWDQSPLTEQALRLHGQVTASMAALSLHANPLPGRAVRTWLAQAFSRDFGGDLGFAAEPRPLHLNGPRAERAMEIVGLRPDDPSTLDPDGGADDVPF
ncbi:hypothetical protein L6R53_08850 [Myxococcota bacterium]|nr:hypothetical protein [Myxococcota bacterium]